MDKDEVPFPLAGGVTGVGVNVQVTVAGWPEQLSATAELKLLIDVTVTVTGVVVVFPATVVTDPVESPTV
jgi:hypothetical protein